MEARDHALVRYAKVSLFFSLSLTGIQVDPALRKGSAPILSSKRQHCGPTTKRRFVSIRKSRILKSQEMKNEG